MTSGPGDRSTVGLSRARRLQLLQHEIASAALSGVGVEEIERSVIAPSSCSEEDKTALRLYGFSFLPRFEQRRVALDRLRAACQSTSANGESHLGRAP